MLLPTNTSKWHQAIRVFSKTHSSILQLPEQCEENKYGAMKGITNSQMLQTSLIQCCPMACLMYFDAGISEYGLTFKRGTKVASLLTQSAHITVVAVISCMSPVLLLSSTLHPRIELKKKLKSVACLAVSDTCSTVLKAPQDAFLFSPLL